MIISDELGYDFDITSTITTNPGLELVSSFQIIKPFKRLAYSYNTNSTLSFTA